MKKNHNNTTSDELNVIWKKDKFHKFSKHCLADNARPARLALSAKHKSSLIHNDRSLKSLPKMNDIDSAFNNKRDQIEMRNSVKESLTSPILVPGEGSVDLRCRLCGVAEHLQLLASDRLDETLRLYFGVQVPPNGVICESCIKCMKITEGFCALVHASFDRIVGEDSSKNTKILAAFTSQGANVPAINPSKEILSLLKTQMSLVPPKKRLQRRRSVPKVNYIDVHKKTIIACNICDQKYPMIISGYEKNDNSRVKKFVCSRCQKKETSKKNNTLSNLNKIELPYKIDLQGRKRLNPLPKKLQVKQNLQQNATKYNHLAKYQCTRCPKKYAVAENLMTHIKTVHETNGNYICSDCGKELQSKDALDKHVKEHTSIKIQCFECVKSFKSNRPWQAHYNLQQNQKNKCLVRKEI